MKRAHGCVLLAFGMAAMLVVRPAAGQERPNAAAAERQAVQVMADLQGFSIVLVIGELQGGQASDDVPAAARRALEDMKDFLPFRTYRLLDSAWMAGSLPVKSASTRVRGPNNRDLELLIIANRAISNATLRPGIGVKFSLVDPGGGTASSTNGGAAAKLRELERAINVAERDLLALVNRLDRNHPDVIAMQKKVDELRRLEEAETRGGRLSPVIDTTFNMDVGETVVVGTSRIQGNMALIALLTAVPRGAR
jgi:hypothetical protein